MVGVLGWSVILAAGVVWEALALAGRRDAWPSLSDLAGALTRTVAGRWVLFAMWLWVGWHLFMRGWRFFLREPASGERASTTRLGGAAFVPPSDVGAWMETAVIPLFAFFLLGAVLLFYARARLAREEPTRGAPAGRGWGACIAHIAATVGGGYALFVGAMAAYDLVFDRHDPSLIEEALIQGGFLAICVAPVAFVLGSGAHSVLSSTHSRAG
jgi:hypothetical protein